MQVYPVKTSATFLDIDWTVFPMAVKKTTPSSLKKKRPAADNETEDEAPALPRDVPSEDDLEFDPSDIKPIDDFDLDEEEEDDF